MPTDARVTAKNVKVVTLGTQVAANAALRAVGNPDSAWSAQKATNVAPVVRNHDVPGNLVTYAELPSLTALASLGYDVQAWLNNVNVVDSDSTRNALQAGTAAPAATLSNASPATASGAGGTVVTLTGTNFNPDMAVKFGTVSAVTVTYISPTSATVVVPAVAAGSRPITVITAEGTSNAQAFTAT